MSAERGPDEKSQLPKPHASETSDLMNRRAAFRGIGVATALAGGASLLISGRANATQVEQAPTGPTKSALGLTDITDFTPNSTNIHPIQQAINSLPAEGGAIYIPPGTHQVNQTLNVSNKNISFIGAGRGVSVLEFSNVTDGIVCLFGTHTQRFTLQGLSLLAATSNCGTAVTLRYPPDPPDRRNPCEASPRPYPSEPCQAAQPYPNPFSEHAAPHFEDFHIGPKEIANHSNISWGRGIEVSDAFGLKVTRFHITGNISDRTNGNYSMDFGIYLLGKCVVNHVSDGLIWNVNMGIVVINKCEGVYFRGVEVVDANRGFYFDAIADGTKPGSVISGCHTNTRQEGIYVRGFTDLAIGDNLIYRLGTQPWVGIRTYLSKYNRIHSNYVISWEPGGIKDGIVLENTQDCVVSGNIVRAVRYGILLDQASSGNLVDANRVIGTLYGIPNSAPSSPTNGNRFTETNMVTS